MNDPMINVKIVKIVLFYVILHFSLIYVELTEI